MKKGAEAGHGNAEKPLHDDVKDRPTRSSDHYGIDPDLRHRDLEWAERASPGRWSIVPCSRSRTTAAPAKMIASVVTKLMMPIAQGEPEQW